MTEENQTPNSDRAFSVQRIYTKDISFETPNSPEVFTKEWRPDVQVNLNTDVQDLGHSHYELVLTVTVTAKLGEQTAWLAEVQQAGIFMVKGYPEQEMAPMMGIYCPNILFPYAREVVSDLVARGSFPQFLLAPVNFEAMFAQHLQQQQAEQRPQ